MLTKIKSAIEKLFNDYRIIFWYDKKSEMFSIYEKLELEDIKIIVIAGNEFYVKYKVLVEDVESKYLLYHRGPKPEDMDNWLLDLNLAYYEFHTEAASLHLQELGLPQELRSVVEQHEDFFRSSERIKKLKELLEKDDLESKICLKMMAVVCNTEPSWEKVLYSLFDEIRKNKPVKYNELISYNLDGILWSYAEKKFSYKPLAPTIKELAVELLLNNFRRSLPKSNSTLTKDAYIFVNRWKENSKAQIMFEELSNQFEKELGIDSEIQKLAVEELLDANTFSVVEKNILIGIRDHLLRETLGNQSVQEWIEKRRTKFFYKDYENLYTALSYGSNLLDEIRKSTFILSELKEGFEAYTKQHYKIDFLYRKYIYLCQIAEHPNLLKDLTVKVEKAYTNSFLLPLTKAWQTLLDSNTTWQIPGIEEQRGFYNKYIQPYIERKNRIFVIISDAFRYEAAVEFREILLNEDRYTADITPVLGMLPSYTQLGMAALLPHKTLGFDNADDTIYADGKSTLGLENRSKVLQSRHPGSIAINAENLLNMRAHDEGREFIKPYQVVYIFHNGIDKTGDDKISEGDVFNAVENEYQTLMKIIKQIANMNGTNMIITADHGFLYQHDRLDVSDFNDTSIEGEVIKSSRRFVLGKNLKHSPALMTFKTSDLGLSGNIEIQIPKSINRLRVQGAGSRFVHGGASLQEIVLPVLEVNKKRKSDIEYVQIAIIGGSTNVTSNQFGVNFYQRLAVGEKVLPIQLRAGFYTLTGKPISDIVTLNFDSTDEDSAAREKRHVFIFISDATQYNNQEIILRLETPVEGTTLFSVYQENKYRMLISFGSEFDEF